MTIKISENLSLALINENHSKKIFELVDSNREYLREWLPFVDRMTNVEFAEAFVKGTIQRNQENIEYAFVIIENKRTVGRIGIYKIDNQNKIGEIGYWLAKDYQGKGLATISCKSIIEFGFSTLGLNRIEIKCGTNNFKSKKIPERLNFMREGVIRQGELIRDKYIDLNLYSIIKNDL